MQLETGGFVRGTLAVKVEQHKQFLSCILQKSCTISVTESVCLHVVAQDKDIVYLVF